MLVKILTHQVEKISTLGGCNVSLEKELLKSCGITGNSANGTEKASLRLKGFFEPMSCYKLCLFLPPSTDLLIAGLL